MEARIKEKRRGLVSRLHAHYAGGSMRHYVRRLASMRGGAEMAVISLNGPFASVMTRMEVRIAGDTGEVEFAWLNTQVLDGRIGFGKSVDALSQKEVKEIRELIEAARGGRTLRGKPVIDAEGEWMGIWVRGVGIVARLLDGWNLSDENRARPGGRLYGRLGEIMDGCPRMARERERESECQAARSNWSPVRDVELTAEAMILLQAKLGLVQWARRIVSGKGRYTSWVDIRLRDGRMVRGCPLVMISGKAILTVGREVTFEGCDVVRVRRSFSIFRPWASRGWLEVRK